MGQDATSPYALDDLRTLTGLSRNSVYEGCRRGEIPHLRVGKRLIFPRALVDAWLTAGAASSRESTP